MLPEGGRGVTGPLPQPRAPDPDGVRLDHLHQDREQVEHGADRPHDLLQGVRGEHAGAAGPAGQVREQGTHPTPQPSLLPTPTPTVGEQGTHPTATILPCLLPTPTPSHREQSTLPLRIRDEHTFDVIFTFVSVKNQNKQPRIF